MDQLGETWPPASQAAEAVGARAPAPRTAQEFASWVRPHWPAMAGLAHRLGGAEGEDALQESLSAAWRKRHQYDPGRGTVRSWLLAIAADQGRKTWRVRRPVPAVVPDVQTAPAGDHDARLDLERALHRLTRRQRVAVELHYFVGLPLAEVAVVLGCAEGTVKSTLSDARARLRREMGEGYR